MNTFVPGRVAVKFPEAEDLCQAIIAPGRSAEIPESSDAYGWFVGSWELDVLHYWATDVSARAIKAEVHAAWVLEGRAVQDAWIMPQRSERTANLDKKLNMYGTTLRVWDSTIQGWRITWRNPAGDHHEEQIGRWSGKDVVQIGTRPDGAQTRWTFTEITPNSFHWLGEALAPHKKIWKLEGEFRARRLHRYDPQSLGVVREWQEPTGVVVQPSGGLGPDVRLTKH